jgi:hypothetical protein
MDLMLLVARLLLAGVLGIAGVAKLADRAGSRQALQDFGVPTALASPLGILLPLAELAVAVALVPTVTAWGGAVGALALLLLFLVAISLTLAKGRAPACRCVGQLSSAPAGWPTLVRNGLLAGLAGVVIWHGPHDVGPRALSWLEALTPIQLGGVGAGVIVLGLLTGES